MSQIKLIGGLGNQMFLYAALRAVQLKNGGNAYLIKDNKKGLKEHEKFGLDGFTLSKDVEVVDKKFSFKTPISFFLFHFYTHFIFHNPNANKIYEKLQRAFEWTGCYSNTFGYYPINSKSKNINMRGYYQTHKYFDEYKDIIQKEFTVKGKVKDKKNMDLIKKTNSVCVHVRRGDYAGTDLDICDNKYYNKAISVINKKVKNPVFFIFSNDIDWCKKNLDLKGEVHFVEGNDRFEDLRLMYSCKHFIICNSTYSWWAQYLSTNENKVVVAPSKWSARVNNPDLYQEEWNLIDIK